jgi:hypothetical protein
VIPVLTSDAAGEKKGNGLRGLHDNEMDPANLDLSMYFAQKLLLQSNATSEPGKTVYIFGYLSFGS